MTPAWQPEFALVLRGLAWVIEEFVPDGLWQRGAPLLPPPKPHRRRFPGRRPIDDRTALAGIVFVLKTGHRIGRRTVPVTPPSTTSSCCGSWCPELSSAST